MGKRSRQGETRRMSRRRRGALTVAAAVVVAASVGWFAYRAAASLPGAAVPDQGNRHIALPTTPHEPYHSDPPTSGPHLAYLAPWGVHTRPIARELQVHNLEDGGVLVQYSCECPDVVERLRAVVRRYDKVILAPYPGMKPRIALTAWARIDTMDELDEARAVRFIEAWRGIDHHR